MGEKNSIELLTSPAEYFQQLVKQAISSQKVNASESVQQYLVQLLSQFLHIEPLQYGSAIPLALKMQQAISSPTEEQIQTFKQLGDYSLYVSGFFSESFKRKIIDVDYYINLGSVAYCNVAGLYQATTLQQLFNELSGKFSAFVEVLSEISHHTQISSEHNDILRLYEKWLKTKNQNLLNLLSKHGVVPIDDIDPGVEQ